MELKEALAEIYKAAKKEFKIQLNDYFRRGNPFFSYNETHKRKR